MQGGQGGFFSHRQGNDMQATTKTNATMVAATTSTTKAHARRRGMGRLKQRGTSFADAVIELVARHPWWIGELLAGLAALATPV
jgi:hypothetical protein